MSRIRRIARKAGNRLKAAGRRMLGLPAGPAILMYHRVNEPGYDPWELAAGLEGGEYDRGDLPRDAVAITFDDGYACNGLNAAPLLAAHGLPATVFLAPAPSRPTMSTGGTTWNASSSARRSPRWT